MILGQIQRFDGSFRVMSMLKRKTQFIKTAYIASIERSNFCQKSKLNTRKL
jgi:hypothetical protein